MGLVKMVGLAILGLVVAAMVYVRLAPSDADAWNQPIEASENRTMAGGAVRVVQEPAPGALAQIDAAARALPRTEVLAGSVAEGRITYVTRSAVFGFLDYTTVEQDGETLKLFARLRFGSSDFGVNAKRLEGLLAALET